MNEGASCSTVPNEQEIIFPVGSSDFNDVVKSKAFVDKTLLISTIFDMEDNYKIIAINAPPRFGKSTNMNMLKRYLEIQVDEHGDKIFSRFSSNFEIFKGHNLLIFQDRRWFDMYFATYPVIYVDFKSVTGNSYNDILDKFRFILHETFKLHHYLLKSDKLDSREKEQFQMFCGEESYMNATETDVRFGLVLLSKGLYKYFYNNEVFVLIDEYDAPVNNMMEKKVFEKVNNLLGVILCNVLKKNKYVKRALLTGVSSRATDNFIESIEITRCTFLNKHPFAKFYGLTEPEADALLHKFNIDDEIKIKVKSYYNGYCSLTKDKLFSICSVIHYLHNNELKSYWQQRGTDTLFKNVLKLPDIRESMQKLCLRNYVRMGISKGIELDHFIQLQKLCLEGSESNQSINLNALFSFLFERGYLTYTSANRKDIIYSVQIPNSEIFDEFQKQLNEYYYPYLNSCLVACADIFKEISLSSADVIFQDFFNKFILLLKELDVKQIARTTVTCRYLLLNILCKAKCSIGAELFVDERRTLLILYKDSLGIIIELQYRGVKAALKNCIKKSVNVFQNEPCLKNVTEKIYIGMTVTKRDRVSIMVLVDCIDLTNARFTESQQL